MMYRFSWMRFWALMLGLVCSRQVLSQESLRFTDFETESLSGLVELVNNLFELPLGDRPAAGAAVQFSVEEHGVEAVLSHLKHQDCEWKCDWLNKASWIINLREINQDRATPTAVALSHNAYLLSQDCSLLDSETKSLISSNYAYMLSRIGRPEEALLIQQQAVADTSDSGYSQYVDLNNLALTYGALGRDSLWVELRRQTLQYAITHQLDSSIISKAFENLTSVQYQLGLYDEVSLTERWVDQYFKASSGVQVFENFELGQLKMLVDNHNYKEAVTIGNQIDTDEEAFHEVAVNSFLIEAFLGLGDYGSALQCLETNLHYYNTQYLQLPEDLRRWSGVHEDLLSTYEDIFYVSERFDTLAVWERLLLPYMDLKMPLWRSFTSNDDSTALNVVGFNVEGAHCVYDDLAMDSVIHQATSTGDLDMLQDFIDANQRVLIVSVHGEDVVIKSHTKRFLSELIQNQSILFDLSHSGSGIEFDFLSVVLGVPYKTLNSIDVLRYNVDEVLSQLSFELLFPGAYRFSLFPGAQMQSGGIGEGALVCAAPANSLPMLPGAEREGKDLEAFFRGAGEPCELLTGRDFNRKKLTRQIQRTQPRILHLACHGDFIDLDEYNWGLQDFVAWVNEEELSEKQMTIEQGIEMLFLLSLADRDGEGYIPAAFFSRDADLSKTEVAFLNCCNTMNPVSVGHFGHRMFADIFHRADVRYCIANRFPIGDEIAESFATNFYELLLKQNDVQMAFHEALNRCIEEGFERSDLVSFSLSVRH